MNKNDIIVISIIVILCLVSIISIPLLNKDGDKEAIIYYDNKVIKKIDLTVKEENTYTVKGYNGDVTIISDYGKIKVKKENSPLHICSKQGYISKSYETIVCLPNKIVIKINDKQKLDGVVG